MKRLTLLLLLLMISTNVLAEWTRVRGNLDDDVIIYMDFGSIKKKDNKVKMWVMKDYKTTQKFENYSYLSSVSLSEYDCEEETNRLIDYYWYSGNMRIGNVVYSNANIKDDIESIMPDSNGYFYSK